MTLRIFGIVKKVLNGYMYIYCAELCCCTACNGNRDILHGSRFTMFPGLLSMSSAKFFAKLQKRNLTNSEWPLTV